MTPAGYRHVLTRAQLYRHCPGHDPYLLQTEAPGFRFAVWCDGCDHTETGPDVDHVVTDWNVHCIARFSGGRGT